MYIPEEDKNIYIHFSLSLFDLLVTDKKVSAVTVNLSLLQYIFVMTITERVFFHLVRFYFI